MVYNWQFTEVEISDVFDAAKTIGGGTHRIYHNPISDWVPPTDYLQWARRSLNEGDSFGYDAAVCYAKRAVCRYIDGLLAKNYLRRFLRIPSYPDKIDHVRNIGVAIPQIIHELIINPRNEIEHAYQATTAKQATRAVELASLLFESTSTVYELAKNSLVSIGSNIQVHSPKSSGGLPDVTFLSDDPFIIFDCLPDNPRVMIVDPKNTEVRFVEFNQLPASQAIEFAKLMRLRDTSDHTMLSLILEGTGLQWVLHVVGLASRPNGYMRDDP